MDLTTTKPFFLLIPAATRKRKLETQHGDYAYLSNDTRKRKSEHSFPLSSSYIFHHDIIFLRVLPLQFTYTWNYLTALISVLTVLRANSSPYRPPEPPVEQLLNSIRSFFYTPRDLIIGITLNSALAALMSSSQELEAEEINCKTSASWSETHLKCTLRTPTVTQMDSVTRTIVKRRYLPRSGTARDVGGIISASKRKKTVSDRRMEMQSVTFSPESEGK